MEEQKHSGLGIASFIISILSGIAIVLVVIAAGVMETTTPGGIDEESAGAIVVGLLLFAFMGTALMALGLGIAGLVQRGRKKIFAVLGTVFSATALAGTTLLLVVGVAAG